MLKRCVAALGLLALSTVANGQYGQWAFGNSEAEISDQITVEEYNLVLDKDQVETYGVQRVPAIAVVGQADVGIRFYGMPEGHELVSLVEAITLVAAGDSGLSDESRALIASVDQPIDIQVFATPT